MALHNIRIRTQAFATLRKVAKSSRGMGIVDAADALAEGWSLLTPEQQAAVLRPPAEQTNDRTTSRRKAVAA